MSGLRRRGAHALSAIVLASSVFVLAGATVAHAATINQTCDAFLYSNGTYDPNGTPAQSGIAQTLNLGDLSGPTEVNAGTSFTVNSPSSSQVLPLTQDSILGTVTVAEVKNVVTQIQVDGAAAIGALGTSGGNVLSPTLTKSGNVLTLTLPGSTTPSAPPAGGPGGNAYFPGGSTLQTPSLSIGLTAGAAGSSISAKIIKQDIDVIIDAPGIGKLGTHLVCTPATNSLGTVQVVTPPPPGAPDAVADTASTTTGKPVTVDVLANDTPDAQLPIDEDSVAITSDPSHGSAVVNADHSITYTPASGFKGTDELTYKVCSQQQVLESVQAEAAVDPCDTAIVTITVSSTSTGGQGGTGGTGTTVTTAAAANELPRTGSSSFPLGMIGFAMCALGFGVLRATRRRIALARA